MIRFISCALLLGSFLGIPGSASATASVREMLAAGRVDEVIAELSHRSVNGLSDAESANLLCRAYYTLEDWDRAESMCKRAIALEPQNSLFHLWLGRVYGEKADRANFMSAASLAGKVRSEFERAVQLSPKDVEARLDLAEFYVDAPGIMGGGEQKAREQAQAIAPVNPGREHWIYARIAEHKHDAAAAEREYRQYIELSKGDAEAWLNLALFFRHQKRMDDMEQAIVKLSQAPNPKADALWEASAALERAGRNYPLAMELVNRYFALGPVEKAPAFRAHYLRGSLLEKQGDKAGAAREYRASLSLARSYGPAQQALRRVDH